MSQKKIALVTGGYSREAEISYRSAKTILGHLDRAVFDIYYIDITRNGWYYVDDANNRVPVCKDDFTITLKGQRVQFDAVFIAMTFNKRYATAVAAAAGITVARSVLLIKGQLKEEEQQAASLRFPVFVKPNSGGSSIGMSKVDQPGTSLQEALRKAFAEDDQVLVEEMVHGREFTVGVFSTGGELIVLPITEVKANADMPFFDFEAKYQGKSTETTPAEIDEMMAEKIRAAAKKVYRTFNCRGVVRIDFIFQENEQQPYMLELNAIPGQSEASIIPQQVRSMGWTLDKLYNTLLLDSLASSSKL
jgi:D-alanine-D-alanine ligase